MTAQINAHCGKCEKNKPTTPKIQSAAQPAASTICAKCEMPKFPRPGKQGCTCTCLKCGKKKVGSDPCQCKCCKCNKPYLKCPCCECGEPRDWCTCTKKAKTCKGCGNPTEKCACKK